MVTNQELANAHKNINLTYYWFHPIMFSLASRHVISLFSYHKTMGSICCLGNQSAVAIGIKTNLEEENPIKDHSCIVSSKSIQCFRRRHLKIFYFKINGCYVPKTSFVRHC